jgi:hypothetical protein
LPRTWIEFFRAEQRAALLGAALGILTGLLKTILIDDRIFRATLFSKLHAIAYQPFYLGFDAYSAPITVLGVVVLACCGAFVVPFLARVLRSWYEGVVSGITTSWTGAFFLFFGFSKSSIFSQLLNSVLVAIGLSAICLWLHLRALSKRGALFNMNRISIPKGSSGALTSLGRAGLDAENPILSWDQDALNRSGLVESLISAVLVSRAPIVAVEGKFGDGKSSILNLVRSTIASQAIVVMFSSWLPGSEQTLALDLFNDIATECKKRYYLPQLRRRLLAYARTICGTLPSLKSVPDLFSPISQNDEIEEIQYAFSRLPRRIVVLLDEVDRLEKDELRVVFKILRGAAHFPNVSYVCAFDREAVEKAYFESPSEESTGYLEKFFPVSYSIPKLDQNLLFGIFELRIVSVFGDLGWFKGDEVEKFKKDLRIIWDDALSGLCTNMRKVTLVTNDVSVAARSLALEVNALDLLVLEVIRRFSPTVYEELWRNRATIVSQDHEWRKQLGIHEDETYRHQFLDKTKEKYGANVAKLLSYLFPDLAERASKSKQLARAIDDSKQEAGEKRISDPDFFPVYFRYQIPETMFSQTELTRFVDSVNTLKSSADIEAYFARTLSETQKGSPRRLDFLTRLGGTIKRMGELQAHSVAIAIARHAKEYVYDAFLDMSGEAGKAIIFVYLVAQHLATTSRVQKVLEQTITDSSDDTFAVRLLKYSKPERNKILVDFSNVNWEALLSAFIVRMEQRYGTEANITQVNLSEGDREAFMLWAKHSENCRKSEIAFWKQYIGQSRKRLAHLVAFIFPANAYWETDPSPHVELLFPIQQFGELLDTLPHEELNADESRYLERLRKLIAGEYKDGVPFPGTER